MATVLAVAGAQADNFGAGRNLFSMDFVVIGNAGNTGDVRYVVNGVSPGSVAYNYRMGVHEVTIDQFTKAMNMDARIGSGNEGFWNEGTYMTGVHAPVGYVDWFEAARFCNWITSGDAYTGAYQFDDSGVLTNVNRTAAVSIYGTVYVLPTEDEWHKAAFYKPVDDGSYSLFASGLNSAPVHGTSNGWNYVHNNTYAVGSPNYMWQTGFGAIEQNGTYDMNGNVWEWNESAYDGVLGDMAESRTYRGGSYHQTEANLRSSARSGSLPSSEFSDLGFRIAAIVAVGVPMPSASVGISQSVEVDWQSVLGETYQVQYSTSLVGESWVDLGEIVVGDGLNKSVFDSTRDDANRFYRVITY